MPDSPRPSKRARTEGRKWSVAVALPSSVVDLCRTVELKTILVGTLARYAALGCFDELVIYEDVTEVALKRDKTAPAVSAAMGFALRNLQYIETPQYLRKSLFEHHPDLGKVGLLPSLDTPHHLKKDDDAPYREGVIVEPGEVAKLRQSGWLPGRLQPGEAWCDVGLDRVVAVKEAKDIPLHTRFTVDVKKRRVVPPKEVREVTGQFWGFDVRGASSLKEVLEDGGQRRYDIAIAVTEPEKSTEHRSDLDALVLRGRRPPVQKLYRGDTRAIVVLGGVGGVREVLTDDRCGYPNTTDPWSVFDCCWWPGHGAGCSKIRTEEQLALLVAKLATLRRRKDVRADVQSRR